MTNIQLLSTELKEAYLRLEEALAEDCQKNKFALDASIKRFELTFELTWKLLKAILAKKHSIFCKSPNETLKEAYKLELIDNEEKWLTLLKARNQAVHIYDYDKAKEIYKIIKSNAPLLKLALKADDN